MKRCERHCFFENRKTSTSGSVTIETAVILPILLFLIFFLLSAIFSAYSTLSDACGTLLEERVAFFASGPGKIMQIIRTVMETGEKIVYGVQ